MSVIPNYQTLTAPLSKLTHKNEAWTAVEQQAFEALKKAMMSPAVLKQPDFTKELPQDDARAQKIVFEAEKFALEGEFNVLETLHPSLIFLI